MRRRTRPEILAGVLWVGGMLGCVTSTGGDAGPVAPTLESLMEREVQLPPVQSFGSADGKVRAAAAGKLSEPLARVEDGWYGAFDIGSDGMVECLFYPQSMDAATSLKVLVARFFESLREQGEVREPRILSVGVGLAEDRPFFETDWLVVVDGAAYQAKFKFANQANLAVYCQHTETGYAEAFGEFYRSVLGSLETDPEPPVAFRDVSIVSIGEMQIGYQTSLGRLDEDDDYKIEIAASTLIPNGPGEFASSDDYIVEFSRPDGELINQVWISSDGENVTQLSLRTADDETGAWQVEGEMQGKPIEARFDSLSPLLSSLGEARLVRRLGNDEAGAQARYRRWLGPLSPGTAVDHAATSLGQSRVETVAGPVTSNVEVDAHGVRSGIIQMGRLEMKLDRVHVEGDF